MRTKEMTEVRACIMFPELATKTDGRNPHVGNAEMNASNINQLAEAMVYVIGMSIKQEQPNG